MAGNACNFILMTAVTVLPMGIGWMPGGRGAILARPQALTRG